MVFGNVKHFAIEAEFFEIHGKWTYGKLRFWINGFSVGNYEDTCDLATSARWGRTFLKASHLRTRSDLDNINSAELYELLHGRFIEPINAPFSKPLPEYFDQEPYILDDVGESAIRDKFAIVVVRKGDGSDRILLKCFDTEDISETIIQKNQCDSVLSEYCDWVEGLRT